MVPQALRDAGFYDYYRLGGKGESLPARDGSKKPKKGELTTSYEGSHSPFGIIWQIASATGWSLHYILWKVNFQTLCLMLADAPHYETHPAEEDASRHIPHSAVELFQTRFKEML